MRPIWKGAITFGLISIPVRLYSAVENKSLKFHLLHDEDGGRIKYQRTCAKCGKEVTWDDIVKGYEFSKDQYVTFTEEELDSLDLDSIKAIDVVTFVPLEDIDPIYFNKTYYVAPETSGLKAYRLLADALEAEGQVGVAKVALRDKEHLATVRLKDDVFVLETMHWPDEIGAAEFEELGKKVEVRDAEVKMARQLDPATVGGVSARGVRGRVPRSPPGAGREEDRRARGHRGRGARGGGTGARSSTSWRPSKHPLPRPRRASPPTTARRRRKPRSAARPPRSSPAKEDSLDTVSIKIPASPEYLQVVRLVAAGLASRLKFTLENIEDLKIAVDELSAYLTGSQGRDGTLDITFEVGDDKISIRGSARLSAGQKVRTELTEFSRMILETVADEASLEQRDGSPSFSLTKRRG